MIGQRKLLEQLNKYTIDTFPRSMFLLGEKGSGKHTLINHISKNILNLPVKDITENISNNLINEIYMNPQPYIYIIDMELMTEKESNTLLKLIEEPLNLSFLILIAESRNTVLNTILNRCFILEMQPYTKEELKQFTNNCANEDLILDVVRTPGKIINLNLNNIKDLYDLCTLMVNKLVNASYLNTLSIADKINYKDEYSKFDLNLFFDMLLYVSLNSYIKDKINRAYDIYLFTLNERKKLIDKRLNKELFMNNFLGNLWKVVRG